MGLVLPAYHDYRTSADEVKSFFSLNGTDYCIYGSFLVPGKLRPGLSDIDIFLIHPTDKLLFPGEITRAFGSIKERITSLGIPLQINLTTQGQLQNKFFSPDGNYLSEVKKGLNSDYVSEKFGEILAQTLIREGDEDDRNMARYFHRKITLLGGSIYEVSGILQKHESKLTKEDRQKIWQLWDGFKKTITFVGAVLRIKTGLSLFGLKDRELLARFTEEFNCSDIALEEFILILESTKNMHDWYEFLKQDGLERIAYIYRSVFPQIFESSARFL